MKRYEMLWSGFYEYYMAPNPYEAGKLYAAKHQIENFNIKSHYCREIA